MYLRTLLQFIEPINQTLRRKRMSQNVDCCKQGEYAKQLSENIENDINARIRELAYFKWELAGKPDSDGAEFWLQAEEEIMSQK
jgi:hypothetical protein